VVIFSAKLDQGYGGFDLYASIFEEGKWSPPVNLGATINSRFDEISPYVSNDGSELYFSTNRHESIGGFDIYFSSYLYEADKWSTPTNMGIPINSPGDETHFDLAADGLTATMTSDRKTANGGKDVFVIRFKNQRKAQLNYNEELAFLNHKIDAEIRGPKTLDLELDLADSTSLVDIEEVPSQLDEEGQEIDVSIAPFYYTSSMDLINEENLIKIDKIESLLRSTSHMHVMIDGHTSEEGILEYKLFSSVKVAERMKQILVNRGIGEQRIHIRGLADNYPQSLPEALGGDPQLASKYNDRIELSFFKHDPDRVRIYRESPKIPSYTSDVKYELYRTLIDNAIMYKIQIAVVSQMYRSLALDLFNDTSVEEDKSTGLYAYTIGLYDNYAEALKTKRDIGRLGFTDAQIVVYYDGRRISEDDFALYVKDFPDLRGLMNYSE